MIVPDIGRSNLNLCRKTAMAMKAAGEKFRAVKADTIVLISPHGPARYDKFVINFSSVLRGSLRQFGDERKFVFENDRELINEIALAGKAAGLPTGLARETELDRGALVPLHYLFNEKDLAYSPKMVHLSHSMLPSEYHFRFGRALGDVLQGSSKVISLVASGDLSHRVTPDAPAGYSPQGRVFDKTLVELIQRKDAKSILNLDPQLVEDAGECGFRPILILLGALSNLRWEVKSLSYEAPFGVGYMVVNLNIK
jgi:aromatic ring-opening dioxygenase LigB subunit